MLFWPTAATRTSSHNILDTLVLLQRLLVLAPVWLDLILSDDLGGGEASLARTSLGYADRSQRRLASICRRLHIALLQRSLLSPAAIFELEVRRLQLGNGLLGVLLLSELLSHLGLPWPLTIDEIHQIIACGIPFRERQIAERARLRLFILGFVLGSCKVLVVFL